VDPAGWSKAIVIRIASLGPLQSFVLLKESGADATRMRRYRARSEIAR
jgi:hypothetical protein